jgi:hypothetical protein
MTLPLDQFPSSGSTDAATVCRLLRTKTAYGDFSHDDSDNWQTTESTTAVFWCLSTMASAGPDDDYAHPTTCRPGRRCFRPELD